MKFVKIPSKRILLDEAAFTVLINGGILPIDGVEIALQDIGYNRMESIIDGARGGGQLTDEEIMTLQGPPSTTRIDLNSLPF